MMNNRTIRGPTLQPIRVSLLVATLAALALVGGCAPPEGEAADEAPVTMEDREEATPLNSAVATIRPSSSSDARGVVRFEAAGEDGIRVTSSFTGLEDGPHAYHIHVDGDCSAPDGTSAGPHFNLRSADTDPATVDRILGNLGEVMADDTGLAEHQALLPEAELSRGGSRSILGRSVVIHARGNDPDSPPDGDAGTRIGCGVIGIEDGQ